MDDAVGVLRGVFGHDAFRVGQRDAVEATLAGRDAVVVLPTGGGKSLCYQVPAVVLGRRRAGPTLVVSPLVALMNDQVAALARRGIAAVALHRHTPSAERSRALRDLGVFDLVYASPERVAQRSFRSALARAGVARIAIDEAHCIDEWGHDFRPEYRALGVLKAELGAPTLALTATASPRGVAAIGTSLGLVDPVVVRVPFDRPELGFAVEHVAGDHARAARCVELLGEAGVRESGRALVYVATRRRTRTVVDALKAAGFAAGFYHAGRTASARERAQEAFQEGRDTVLVATTAFGMGIDLPDVRAVVHAEAPSTLEAYVQQAGRAGRDGRPARCVLLYGPGDARTQERLRGPTPWPGAVEGWEALQGYVFGSTCRSVALAARFGDVVRPCGVCDVCLDADGVADRVASRRSEIRKSVAARDVRRRADDAIVLTADQVEAVLTFVGGLRRPAGRTVVAAALRGGRTKRVKRLRLQENPAFGTLRGTPDRAILRSIDTLLDEGRLAAKGRKYPTLWLPGKPVRAPAGSRPPRLKPSEQGLEGTLRAFRRREARRRRWKPYQVFPDAVLRAILAARPQTAAELLELPGMGPKRIEKFSEAILGFVAEAAAAPSGVDGLGPSA